MDRLNSATRLYEIVESVCKVNQKSAWTLWADALAIETSGKEKIGAIFEVARRLVWIDEEVSFLAEQFSKKTDYLPDLWEMPTRKLREAANPLLLHAQQEHVKQHLTPEVRLAFRHLAYQLPSSEAPLSDEAVKVIKEVVNSLREYSGDETLDDFLNGVLLRHANLLQRALDAYPIFGLRAFTDAVRDASGELYAVSDLLDNDKAKKADRSAIQTLRAGWDSIAIELNKVKNIASFGVLAYKGIKFLHHL